MSGLGIIGGTAFKEWNEFEVEEKVEKETPWGTPSSRFYHGFLGEKEILFLLRHGEQHDIPPHRINHRANFYALQEEVDEVIGICSGGALKDDIEVPTVSIPEDYINLWNIPSFYEERINHVTPGLSEGLREELIQSADDLDPRTEDVYIQTSGPRLETKAEVNLLKDHADLVGMTMASEATLAKEASLDYAALITVDNYANGIIDEEVEYEEIVETARESWSDVENILQDLVKDR